MNRKPVRRKTASHDRRNTASREEKYCITVRRNTASREAKNRLTYKRHLPTTPLDNTQTLAVRFAPAYGLSRVRDFNRNKEERS